MIRVLVIAESSLLGDAIVSRLAQEDNLDVVRIKQHDLRKISKAIPERCSVLIIIEDGDSDAAFITANNLFQDYGCFRVITISSEKHHLHVCDSYDMPVSGLTQVINLAKGFSQEHRSEVRR
jgi:hypothetical protein